MSCSLPVQRGKRPVFVNHEALMFRRGRIDPRSFAMPLYAAHFKRPSRYAWFLFKNYGLRRGARRIAGGLWVLDNLSTGSYFHWVAECLPRLLRAEREFPGEHRLVLPRSYERDPYVAFTLPAFPHVETIEWIEDDSKLRVDRLAFVARPSPPDVFVPHLVREVGRRLRERVDAWAGEDRLYFSRSDAGRRRAANEPEVVRVLREHGFRIVTVDPSKPDEQVTLAASARVIAGVHGAALTNIIFMPSGGHLLEFRHPRLERFPDCYRPLALALGHTYQPQMSQPEHDSLDWGTVNRSDITVDLDLLRTNLESIA
jgi:capsular polysaccharide biosynthesis protein